MSEPGDPFLDDDRALSPSDAAAAILVASDRRYLMQLRDDKPGIFYPGHWGCFGGAVEAGDASVEAGLRRELREELGVEPQRHPLLFFTVMSFDLAFAGLGIVRRAYYEARLDDTEIAAIRLGEGARFALMTAREALSAPRVTPYDAFALWLHANRTRVRPRNSVEDVPR